MIRRVAVLGFLAFSGFMALSCSDRPIESPMEPQFAKGGGKPGDGGSGKDLEFGLYEVEIIPAPHTGRGFTPDPLVDEAVYEYLRTDPERTRLYFANGNSPSLLSGPEAYFGCPDQSQPCSQVTLHFTGSAFTLYGGMANMVVGCGLESGDPEWGCMNDFDEDGIEVRRLASTAGGNTFPSIPWELLGDAILTDAETGVKSFTYYWQGQRGILHRAGVEVTEKVRGKLQTTTTYAYTELWDYLPDLYTVGTAETPVFSFGARTSSLNGATYYAVWTSYRRDDNCTSSADDCRGSFKGVPSGDPLFMWVDLWELDSTGRFEFAVQAFTRDPTATDFPKLSDGRLDYMSSGVLEANPVSHSRVMMVPPDGPRTMLNNTNSGRRISGYKYKVGVAETQYIVDLTNEGCYEFHALSLVAKENSWGTPDVTFAVNRKVWVPGLGSDQVFHVDYHGMPGSTMAMGPC